MKKLSENLKRLIAEYNLNTAELARATGLLQPVMHRMVAGHTDNPRIDTLLPISRYFKITVNQLVGDEPLPLLLISDTQASRKKQKEETPSYSSVPLLKNWDEIEKFIAAPTDYVTDDWVNIDSTIHRSSMYSVKIKDSTMLPRFLENTLLIVDGDLDPQNGDFVIIALKENEDAIFKQVFYDGADIYLKPLNSDFKTIVLTKNAKHKFLGVATESRTRLKSDQS